MKRIPRLLVIAFALSLLLHLIVALILHPPTPRPQDQAEVVSIEHRPATIAVQKFAPPPPPPRRTPSPLTAASAPPAKRHGLAAPAGVGSRQPAEPTAAPPAPALTPSPVASSSGACTDPNAGAAVAASPPPPDIAPAARADGTSGVALVRVALDANGQVTGAGVAQSTGNSSLDLVAVSMARNARYTPALHDCKPVAAAYTFSVKFVAW